jgi:hypothetical protein
MGDILFISAGHLAIERPYSQDAADFRRRSSLPAIEAFPAARQ